MAFFFERCRLISRLDLSRAFGTALVNFGSACDEVGHWLVSFDRLVDLW